MWKSLRQQDFQSNKYIFISSKEKLLLAIKSVVAVLLIDYCFYQSVTAFFALLLPGLFFYETEKRELLHKKKEEARQQFKEMLLLAVALQKAGYSVENAFLKGYEDMKNLYGQGSSICRMLWELQTAFANNCSIADVWKDIGKTCGIEEIEEFAAVFEIAKESSGNMSAIMERTAAVIESKAATQKEIETLLSARKLEQKIMNIMPFLLMLYISVTSPGYFNEFYHSLRGVVIMTFCLMIYLSAYLIGVKIAAIDV